MHFLNLVIVRFFCLVSTVLFSLQVIITQCHMITLLNFGHNIIVHLIIIILAHAY